MIQTFCNSQLGESLLITFTQPIYFLQCIHHSSLCRCKTCDRHAEWRTLNIIQPYNVAELHYPTLTTETALRCSLFTIPKGQIFLSYLFLFLYKNFVTR